MHFSGGPCTWLSDVLPLESWSRLFAMLSVVKRSQQDLAADAEAATAIQIIEYARLLQVSTPLSLSDAASHCCFGARRLYLLFVLLTNMNIANRVGPIHTRPTCSL